MRLTIERLRADAIRRTLFSPGTLRSALRRLGFVQADPIRAPARAQDLILRHRVAGYRAGDLERRYPRLDIEEDFFYAYGFLPRGNWRLLHPRTFGGLSALEEEVLEIVRRQARIHPRELEAHLGRDRSVNGWGGYSKATTQALHRLHYRGLLRIAARDKGIRLYEPTQPSSESLSSEERTKRIVLLLLRIFAPVPLPSLREILRFFPDSRPLIEILLRAAELETADVGDVSYIWPAGTFRAAKPPATVKFLAPFDPLVWDRRRFEHLWGWRYRFEAYTPLAKRQLGYYAMPLLWLDSIIGWANVSREKGRVAVQLGFVAGQPKSAEFKQALAAEIERLRFFLVAER